MNLLCIGDSLTFGYSVGPENSWVKLINGLKFSTINKGINGDTSTGILSRIYQALISCRPDICLIMCGSNDLLIGKSIKSIMENIELITKDCLGLGVIPIIMAPPKIYGNLALERWDSSLNYDEINSQLENFSKELKDFSFENNFKFIDITNSLPFHISNYSDGLHLSIKGNEIVAEIVKKVLY
ncbi:GDSL-type esterase/lipase family protein [Clostridium sp.]|uniref:GDSL-type esterase/lipase family protein n=1 Tax=Clostridium sp. TaxID=1506 RepID=UPI0026031CBF|nr:GDSL-type esterase/lipase family protein [Clostridium sp.]